MIEVKVHKGAILISALLRREYSLYYLRVLYRCQILYRIELNANITHVEWIIS
jgi:hypothetical protein